MSDVLDRMFRALTRNEVEELRARTGQLTRERDVYLESLQHVQARADQLGHQNRELARLIPVALAADALLKYMAELADNRVICARDSFAEVKARLETLAEACEKMAFAKEWLNDIDALDNAVDKVPEES